MTAVVEGKVVDVKDDPHSDDHVVLIIEKDDGDYEEVVVPKMEADDFVRQLEAN